MAQWHVASCFFEFPIRRQVEGLLAQWAVKIIGQLLENSRLQVQHVKLNHGMTAGVGLAQVSTHGVWRVHSATEHACLPHKFQHLSIGPQICKITVSKDLFHEKSVRDHESVRQDRGQCLFSHNEGCKGHFRQPVIHHGDLSKWKTDMA